MRFVFIGLTLLGVYAAIELGSLALFRIVDGRWYSAATIRSERRALRESIDVPAPDAESVAESGLPRHVVNKRVHPYVGFVQDPRGRPPFVPGMRDLAVNRFGYIDTGDPIRVRGDDGLIVGIVGGSVARDFSLIGAGFLEEFLKTSAEFSDKEIAFVRMALSGYKQPQQLITITYLLSLGAEFDVVINLDGFNEIALHLAENARTQTFAAYPRDWYYQIAELPEQLSDEYQYLRVKRERLADWFSQPLLRSSVLGNLIWRLRDRQLSHDLYAAHEAIQNARPAQRVDAASGPHREYPDDAAAMTHLVSIWKASSLQLHRLLRANGTAYVHVLHPNQYYEGTKPMGEKERRSAYRADYKYRPGAVMGYPMLVREGEDLRRRGVAFLDLTRAFEDHDEPLYVDACCHFNKWGHKILAEQIAAAIAHHYENQTLDSSVDP